MNWLLILLPTIVVACTSSRQSPVEPLILVKATSQQWFGGVEGSGNGTNYRVTVKQVKSGKVKFQAAWVGKRKFDLDKVNDNVGERGAEYNLNFRLHVHQDISTGEKITTPPEVDPAPTYQGQGLIEFIYNDQSYQLNIPQFEQMEALYYP